MKDIDKTVVVMLAMLFVFILLIVCMIITSDYLTTKLETEQPKYFIELKGNLYELKEVNNGRINQVELCRIKTVNRR